MGWWVESRVLGPGPYRLASLGEKCKLPQRGAAERISCILEAPDGLSKNSILGTKGTGGGVPANPQGTLHVI